MKQSGMRVGFVFVALSCGTIGAKADDVDAYIKAQMEKRHIPGVSVAVVREGKPVLLKGYGVANAELETPATKDTVYELASVTKQFTATAIMLLAREHKVALDEKITTYLSGLPAAWGKVTVRHLLTHTSGIKSYTETAGFDKTMRKDFTQEELLKLVTVAPLDFQPGEKWHYSNTGFFLLGMIIEKVSGKSYNDFLQERIFKPLGMTATRVNDLHDIIKNRAVGYDWANGALKNGEYVSPTQPFAAGALVSSVVDMAKWDAALYSDTILPQSALQQMWTPTKLNDGKTADYGFGWSVETFHGHKLISHGGGIPGFSTQISRFADDKLTVIVLTNLDGGSADALAKGIAALFIPALKEAELKPSVDKEPKTTQRFKDVLLRVADGTAAPELFTPEARAALFPDFIKQATAQLKALGALKSFQFMQKKSEEKKQVYTYRAVFGNTGLIMTFILSEDDKIAGLGGRPE